MQALSSPTQSSPRGTAPGYPANHFEGHFGGLRAHQRSLRIRRPPESIIKAIIRIINSIRRCSHDEPRVRHAVPHLDILITALIIDSDGRTPRLPGILDNHKAARVYYQSDYQNIQARSSRTQSSQRSPPPSVSDNRFDNRPGRMDPELARDPC